MLIQMHLKEKKHEFLAKQFNFQEIGCMSN